MIAKMKWTVIFHTIYLKWITTKQSGISPWDWANSSGLQLSATPLATMAMMPTQAKLFHTVSMVTTASFNAVPSPLSQHVFCPLTAPRSPKWRTVFWSHGGFASMWILTLRLSGWRWRMGSSKMCTTGDHKYEEPPYWKTNRLDRCKRRSSFLAKRFLSDRSNILPWEAVVYILLLELINHSSFHIQVKRGKNAF